MGTRSRIAMRNEDGTFTSIYCQWNGYPSWMGRILLENYTDEQSVHKLIALGDISILGQSAIITTNTKRFPSNRDEEYEYLFENGEWLFCKCDYPLKWWKKLWKKRWQQLTKRHVME